MSSLRGYQRYELKARLHMQIFERLDFPLVPRSVAAKGSDKTDIVYKAF